jgi:hypothetical protein
MSNIKINESINNNSTKKTAKTDRKNKTKQSVNWIQGHYTFSELHKKNSEIVEITLRTKINKAVENNAVVAIGTIPNRKQKGRPEVVYSSCPVTPEILESARNIGTIFNEKFSASSIEIVNINNNTKPSGKNITIPMEGVGKVAI